MKYQWLLFDADNTLFDFDGAARSAFTATLEHFEIKGTKNFHAIYKRANSFVWKQLEDGKITTEELRYKRFALFLEKIKMERDPMAMNTTFLNELVEHSTLLEEAKPLLDRLHGQYRMAIITNGLKEVQRPRISKVALTEFFDEIIVSDEIGVAKPDAGFFEHTFEAINHPQKDEVLVIGDNLNSDIRGGNGFGLDTCWYNPKGKDKFDKIKPTYEIKQLSELPKYL